MGTSGKHDPDEVLIGIHATPEFKALVAIVAEVTDRSITDVVVDGILAEATRAEVFKDGKVLPEFEDHITIKAAQIRAAKKERQAKHA